MAIKVSIVEDDPHFSSGLVQLLEKSPALELTGVYASGIEAVDSMSGTHPDVALVDLELPDISGIDVIRRLAERKLKTEPIVLTAFTDDDHLFAALMAGAVGYIVKSEVHGIPDAIVQAMTGGSPMSVGIARRILNHLKDGRRINPGKPELQTLTKREMEVLELLSRGYPSRKVADCLYVSYSTVRCHQKSIYRKLQVRSVVEALAIARDEKS